MGNFPTSLRTAIRWNDGASLTELLEKAGEKSGDLINNDYSQDCILQSCRRAVGNAFYYAVMKNRVASIKVLLEYGADVHSTGYCGETCLHCACRQSSADSVRILVEHGADVKATDDQGRFPIHSAAMAGYGGVNSVAIIKYLVQEVGALEDINLRDFSKRTPLHFAANTGRLDSVTALVELGADVNAQSNTGNTPLHAAFRHQNVYDYLIEKGADPDIENNEGKKPTRPIPRS